MNWHRIKVKQVAVIPLVLLALVFLAIVIVKIPQFRKDWGPIVQGNLINPATGKYDPDTPIQRGNNYWIRTPNSI